MNDNQQQDADSDVPQKAEDEGMGKGDNKTEDLKKEFDAVKATQNKLADELRQEEDTILTMEKILAPLIVGERELSSILKDLERNAPVSGDPGEERKREEERWRRTGEYTTVQQQKIQTEGELEKHKLHAEDLRKELHGVNLKERKLSVALQIIEVDDAIAAANAEINDIATKRTEEQNKFEVAKIHRGELWGELEKMKEEENTIEGEEADVSRKTLLCKSREEETVLLKARFDVNQKRHNLEVSRWKAEDELSAANKMITEIEARIKELILEDAETREHIEDLNIKKHSFWDPKP